MSQPKKHIKVVVACRHCYLAYDGVFYKGGIVTSSGLNQHISKNPECYNTYVQDPEKKYRKKFFDLNSSIVKRNASLVKKNPKKRPQIFPTVPPSNFGLTGTSNCPGPQPTLGGTSSKTQKIDHLTLN